MPSLQPLASASGLGSFSSPEFALGLGVVSLLVALPPITRRVLRRRYGDVAVEWIVPLLAVTVLVYAGGGGVSVPAVASAFAVACAGFGAGRMFGRASSVWAAGLVATVYFGRPPMDAAEPWLVAWTGLWMGAAAPRLGDRFGLKASVAVLVPVLVALSLAFGPWASVANAGGLSTAVIAVVVLLPACALLGAVVPGGVARMAGAGAVALLLAAAVRPAGDATTGPAPDLDRSAVATVTDEELAPR
ncbi:MAG: hypothetical protein AAGB93_19380 [Planctomycetota bacterium]